MNSNTYTINAKNYHNRIPNDITNVFISNDLNQSLYKQVFRYRFNGCNDLNVKMHDSITEIENEAFQRCMLIRNITMPNNLTRIGANAFQYCDKS